MGVSFSGRDGHVHMCVAHVCVFKECEKEGVCVCVCKCREKGEAQRVFTHTQKEEVPKKGTPLTCSSRGSAATLLTTCAMAAWDKSLCSCPGGERVTEGEEAAPGSMEGKTLRSSLRTVSKALCLPRCGDQSLSSGWSLMEGRVRQ